MYLKRLSLSIGGLVLTVGLLAACGGTSPTATLAPVTSAAPSGSAAPASVGAASPTATRAASPTTGSPTTGSPTTAASPTRAASPAATPTRAGTPGTPGTPGAGTPTAGFVPSQAYIRLQGQPSHRQNWAFTGFTIGGLSGDLKPIYDVVGTSRKVVLPDVAGIDLEAYQVAGVISVPDPVGGGFVVADASNPLTPVAQELFGLPDTLIFNLAPVNAVYTQQGTQPLNGRTTIAYRTQITLADLGIVSPDLQGQAGTATTMIYLDSTTGILIAMESTIRSNTTATTATARLDVTDIGQVPAIVVPQ
jgi:hypothetical protein